MTYRNRGYLDLAHEMQTCTVRTQWCVGVSPEGLEPAHGDWSWLGRGIGHKASDAVFAATCHQCHRAIDGLYGLSQAERQDYWMRGAITTWRWLVESGLLAPTGAKAVDLPR